MRREGRTYHTHLLRSTFMLKNCWAWTGAFAGLSAILLSGFVPTWAMAASPFGQAVQEYSAGRYQSALADIDRALGTEPHSALLHYYKANSLAHLNRHELAVKEYRLSYALDPDGDTASYCLIALRAYGETVDAQPALSASAGQQVTSQALAKIQQEAQSASQSALQEGKAAADFQIRKGELAASRIRNN